MCANPCMCVCVCVYLSMRTRRMFLIDAVYTANTLGFDDPTRFLMCALYRLRWAILSFITTYVIRRVVIVIIIVRRIKTSTTTFRGGRRYEISY